MLLQGFVRRMLQVSRIKIWRHPDLLTMSFERRECEQRLVDLCKSCNGNMET